MRSAAVFFSKRHANRAGQCIRGAEGKWRRSGIAITRGLRRAVQRSPRVCPVTRGRAYVARRTSVRARPELLVPRGFLPLRIH